MGLCTDEEDSLIGRTAWHRDALLELSKLASDCHLRVIDALFKTLEAAAKGGSQVARRPVDNLLKPFKLPSICCHMVELRLIVASRRLGCFASDAAAAACSRANHVGSLLAGSDAIFVAFEDFLRDPSNDCSIVGAFEFLVKLCCKFLESTDPFAFRRPIFS